MSRLYVDTDDEAQELGVFDADGLDAAFPTATYESVSKDSDSEQSALRLSSLGKKARKFLDNFA